MHYDTEQFQMGQPARHYVARIIRDYPVQVNETPIRQSFNMKIASFVNPAHVPVCRVYLRVYPLYLVYSRIYLARNQLSPRGDISFAANRMP